MLQTSYDIPLPCYKMLSEANMNNPTGGIDTCVHSYTFPLSNQQYVMKKGFAFSLLSQKRDRNQKFQKCKDFASSLAGILDEILGDSC